MGLPARGAFDVRARDGTWRALGFDAHQSAYLAFASRALSGGYEPVETLFLDAVLPRGGVFYDIGANWGYYSLLAATNPHFKGQTVAFEIAEAMNAALRRMAETIAPDRLTVAGYGLSDRSGLVAATPGHAAHLTKVLPARAGEGTAERQVPVKRMDDLALPPPDLIKMDVEDHEADVLLGGRRTVETHRPLILFESRAGTAETDAGGLLRQIGYRLYVLRQRPGEEGLVRLSPAGASETGADAVNMVAVPDGGEQRWFGQDAGGEGASFQPPQISS